MKLISPNSGDVVQLPFDFVIGPECHFTTCVGREIEWDNEPSVSGAAVYMSVQFTCDCWKFEVLY